MTLNIREARADEIEQLIPILRQAEESEWALRWSLANLSDVVYRMDEDGQLVGAATMQWRNDPCEIMELAIVSERQGRGLGKQFVLWLLNEARRRGKRQLLVGTANSSIANIVFYQRCGLRMDHVRHDYFWYYSKPHYENGLQIQDMLVFRYDLVAPNSTLSVCGSR
jgi:N-acetylglutamate synthase-like GNAT family acetyltransferase